MGYLLENNLAEMDGKYVRIVTESGEIFEGECIYQCREYCEAELGTDEAALQIDDWVFYVSDIRSVKEIERESTSVWYNRNQHCMKLAPAPFEKIENGTKTIEMRLWDEKRQRVKPGDIIRFEMNNDPEEVIRAKVKALHVFASFEDLYANLPPEKCGYSDSETASPLDMRAYYTAEEENKYGVVGIEIELI